MKHHDGLLNGRQIYWLLIKHLATAEDLIQVYELADLQKVVWHGDEHIETFLTQWLNISRNLRDTLSDATLSSLLLIQLKKSTELKSDIDHYNRVGVDHKDHSYEFLLNCLRLRVNLRRQEINQEKQQEAVRQALKSTGGHATGAAGAEGDEKTKKQKAKEKRAKSKAAKAAERALLTNCPLPSQA